MKKARMGAYQELAWRLHFEVVTGLTTEQKAQLVKSFADFADTSQLGIAGVNGQFIVVSLLNCSAPTIAEQRLLENWLTANHQVHRVIKISPLEQFSDAHLEFLLVDTEGIKNESFVRFFA
ncbi:50S ribosome-binding protein YggL [Hymenobacter sp. BRD67]|uniref:50S ribosome-binding protein YggL n=1 Tax=Hymenobacter sp. BRD67 TaxID=2675877 RepID=UPI0015663D22|nr:50S ribosome-binding protein YggL [Hymenobacter sp. BRD67]QKG51491.1 DUF469 family protein [Hymenobacter sp. BRD67]